MDKKEQTESQEGSIEQSGSFPLQSGVMSLRDKFAMTALQSIIPMRLINFDISNTSIADREPILQSVAYEAYVIAQAMLEEKASVEEIYNEE